jgi:hypothetical protein
MKRYIEGRYFPSDKEMSFLKNPPERILINKLTEVYPAGRTAKKLQLELADQSDIVKSTIHDKLDNLKEYYFIHELTKKQQKELEKRPRIDHLLSLDKNESTRSKKFVIEDTSSILNLVHPYPLSPGYVRYSQLFIDAWKHIIKNQLIQKSEIDDVCKSLFRFVEKIMRVVSDSTITEVNSVAPTKGIEHCCSNCGVNHEVRDFIRAMLLYLVDQMEINNDFIEFLEGQKFVNEKGYEFYKKANKQFSQEVKEYTPSGMDNNKDLDPTTRLQKMIKAILVERPEITAEQIREMIDKQKNFKKMMELLRQYRPDLNHDSIRDMIDDKKRKIGAGYLTDQGALFLVAADLGLSFENIKK